VLTMMASVIVLNQLLNLSLPSGAPSGVSALCYSLRGG